MTPDPMSSPQLNTFLILTIAALNAYTAWATLRARGVILQLEKNTNSMKDALVSMTAKSSFREGSDASAAAAATTAKSLAVTTAEALAAAIGAQGEPVKVDVVKLPPGGKMP